MQLFRYCLNPWKALCFNALQLINLGKYFPHLHSIKCAQANLYTFIEALILRKYADLLATLYCFQEDLPLWWGRFFELVTCSVLEIIWHYFIFQKVLLCAREYPSVFQIQMAATACLFNLSKPDLGAKIHPKILKEIVKSKFFFCLPKMYFTGLKH